MSIKKYPQIIVLVLLLALSGCLNYEQISTVKKDGMGEMFIHYWTELNFMPDSLVLASTGIFNNDTLANKYKSNHTVIEFTEVYKDFSDSTIHAKVKFSFENIDSLNSIPALKNYNFNFYEISEDEYYFSQDIINSDISSDSGEVYTMTYTYYLPGKILSHNAKSVSRNKLVWEFFSNENTEIQKLEATIEPFRLKETPPWVYYSGIFVFFIVLYFLFRFKKN